MNKELINNFIGEVASKLPPYNTQLEPTKEHKEALIVMEKELPEFINQIRLETLRDVLPEESKDCLLSVEPSTAFRERGFNACRQEIINNAKLKGIEI